VVNAPELAGCLLVAFVRENGIEVLNVTGSSGSKDPRVAAFVKRALEEALYPRVAAFGLC